jgi:hypothetical protein
MPNRMIAAGITLVLVLTACSSAAPAGSTPAAGASATPQAVTTPAATAATSQGPFVLPSFAGDPDLAARFPKQVDGKPVGPVTTGKFIDFLRARQSTQAEIDTMSQAFAAVGIDLNSVVVGSANATVGGSTVGIFAFRLPGQDASKLIQNYLLLSSSNEGDKLSPETVGGKNVTVVRDSAGYASTWMYANGDILWTVNTSNQKEAEAVFAALS